MDKLQTSEKIIFGIAALVVVVFSAFGFYLIDGEFKIKSLAVSGHAHILLFAYGAVIFGLLMNRLEASEFKKRILAVLMSLTYFGPLSLLFAAFTANTALLGFTTPMFDGLFVALWAVMAFYIFKSK